MPQLSDRGRRQDQVARRGPGIASAGEAQFIQLEQCAIGRLVDRAKFGPARCGPPRPSQRKASLRLSLVTPQQLVSCFPADRPLEVTSRRDIERKFSFPSLPEGP